MAEQSQRITEQPLNDTGAKPPKPSSAYRKLRRRLSKTSARIPIVWFRHRNFFPSDIFFASYPKSGTTWVRFTLFEILTGMPAGFRSTAQLMPGVGHHHRGLPVLAGGGRLIGTHEQYRKDYHRAIYLVRDARDVLLSEFAFLKALDFVRDDLDEFISTFLFTPVSGFGPWQRHVSSWLDSPIATNGSLLVVRFEDVREDPVFWFTRMAHFLHTDVDSECVERAVANNSLERMREKEHMEPVRASVRGRFVRSGAVRGWTSKLSQAQLQLIEQHTGSVLLRLGHQLSTDDKKGSPRVECLSASKVAN